MLSSKLTKVLVATDFSGAARHALERVPFLPLDSRAHVKIVYISPDLSHFKSAASLEAASAQRLLEEESFLRKHLKLHAGVSVESEVQMGDAAEGILQAAMSMNAELIVMGRRGHTKTGFFGSIAERVSHHAPVATLLVSQKPDSPYQKPICAVADEPVDDMGQVLGKIMEAKSVALEVIHAWHIPFEGMLTMAGESVLLLEQDREAMKKAAEENLNNHVARLQTTFEKIVPRLCEGEAGSVIVGQIKAMKADLVILKPRSRPVWVGSLLGSVARSVMAMVDCDILLVNYAKK